MQGDCLLTISWQCKLITLFKCNKSCYYIILSELQHLKLAYMHIDTIKYPYIIYIYIIINIIYTRYTVKYNSPF